MKGENNIWRGWWLGLAYFNPVQPLYRNHPTDLIHKSVDWFLYNGKIALNGKVGCLVKVNVNLYIHVMVFKTTLFFISVSVA